MAFTDGSADRKHMHAGCGMSLIETETGKCIIEHADQVRGAAQIFEAQLSAVEAVFASTAAAEGGGNLGEVVIVRDNLQVVIMTKDLSEGSLKPPAYGLGWWHDIHKTIMADRREKVRIEWMPPHGKAQRSRMEEAQRQGTRASRQS